MGTVVESSSRNDRLWESARLGHESAFGQLAQHYRPYLKVVAAGVLGDKLPNDASDVINNGLLHAFKNVAQCEAVDAVGFLRWLTAIVRNEACRMLRGADSVQPLPVGSSDEERLAAGSSGPDQRASRREQAARLMAAIDRLRDDHQTVIHLRNFDELSFDEVARRMKRSNAAVRKLWTRAVGALRQELEKTDER